MAWPEYISYISYITFISHFAHVQLRTASGYAHADSFPDTDLFCWYFTFKSISSQKPFSLKGVMKIVCINLQHNNIT